jgi:hypothetical protein
VLAWWSLGTERNFDYIRRGLSLEVVYCKNKMLSPMLHLGVAVKAEEESSEYLVVYSVIVELGT